MRVLAISATAFALSLTVLVSSGVAETATAGSTQNTQSGQATAGSAQPVLYRTDCPREFRGIYRGVLYCRQPEYQLLTLRNTQCPDNVKGLYRGDMFCFGRR